MNRYNKYKPSGIEWIGEIPAHWEVIPIKYTLSTPLTDGPHETPNFTNDGIPFISAEAIKNDEIDFEKRRGFISVEDHERYSQKYKPQRGDIYMVKSGATTGNLARVKTDKEFNIWSPLAAFRPKRDIVITDFLFFFMKSRPFYTAIELGWNYGTQQNIGMNVIENLRMIQPSIKEQTAIAAYLDRKTAEIDALIADKKRMLELYEEEKTAIINEAVTKGIDQAMAMRDSGIEWLGEIPEHWEVKRLKYISEITLGKMLTTEDKGGYQLKPYLRAANLNWLKVDVSHMKEMWFSEKEIERYHLKYNDLLVSEGGEVGRTCIWRNELDECYIQNSVHKVTVNEPCDPVYFLYQFFTLGKIGAFDAIVNRISIAHLTVEKLREITFLTPPLKEQQAIVHHIETECSRIDTQIKRAKKLIVLLTEYRTALISEVVTGKVRVVRMK